MPPFSAPPHLCQPPCNLIPWTCPVWLRPGPWLTWSLLRVLLPFYPSLRVRLSRPRLLSSMDSIDYPQLLPQHSCSTSWCTLWPWTHLWALWGCFFYRYEYFSLFVFLHMFTSPLHLMSRWHFSAWPFPGGLLAWPRAPSLRFPSCHGQTLSLLPYRLSPGQETDRRPSSSPLSTPHY